MIQKIRTHKYYPILLLALLLTLLVFTAAYAANIDAADKWAWGTNVGWLNFNDANGGVTVYDDHLEGYVWAENVGWMRLGTYEGGGAHTYANDAANTYGVNNDGSGNLSGYAWGTNVGWINFNPTHSQVTIDPATGSFDGYAWGENIGWIHFKNTTGNAYNVVTTWQSGGGGGSAGGDDDGTGGDDGGGGKVSRKCPVGTPGDICNVSIVKVTIDENTVPDGSQIVIREVATGNFQLGDRVFDIKVIGPDGSELTTFNPPIEVCLKPTNALLKQAGWNFSNLQMFHSHAGGPWAAIANTYEKDGKLCARIYQLSEFAIGVAQLPATGFAPNVVTELSAQPAEKAYSEMDGFVLEIPSIGVEMPIVGIPLTGQGWDVSWLGGAAGYLEGTAYPTWAGNTAITAHVWDNLNNPGPFVDLHTLKHGDEIIIHAFGMQHIYEVRALTEVRPNDLSALPHSEYDVLTLITCLGYDEANGTYPWRLAVRAVLMSIE